MERLGGPIVIVLIDGSEADAIRTRLGLHKSGVAHRLEVFDDPDDAVVFLTKQEPYANAPTVDLILYGLPPSGFGLSKLAAIKGDPLLKEIPVCVLASSEGAEFLDRAYASGANCVLRKPDSLDGWVRLFASISDLWLRVAQLPSRAGAGSSRQF